jgi:hypothetical protein
MRAIEVLAEMMEHSADDGVRIKAANSLLDRGYGKPVQAVELTGEGGGPTRMEIAYFNDWKSKDEVPSGDANGDDQGK